MGLLDNLLLSGSANYGGEQGGLLDLLSRSMAQNNQYQPSAGFPPVPQAPTFADRFNAIPNAPQPVMPSGRQFDGAQFDPSTYAPNQAPPIAVGNYQMPRMGDAGQYMPSQAALPPNSQPTQGTLPQASATDISAQGRMPQPAQSPSESLPPALQDRSFLGRIGNPDGLIARLTGNDSRTIAQQNLKAQYDATREALVANGVPHAQAASTAMLSVLNPEAAKTVLPELLTNKEEFKTIKDGLGMEHPAFVNTREQTINGKPIAEYNRQEGTQSGLGDMNKSGGEYFATLPKQVQGTVQGMLDGTIQPPSSFAAAKPYWQGMLAAAKNVDPTFDENKWASRHKMSTDVAASGNSSIGGILSNGKSAFKHLAEYTGSAADLGNASHDYPLGGIIAHGQNYLGNTLGGSDTNAKIKAINDNLGHYGQESTKFYAGTGGGVEERMNALKEMNPTTTSSAEMAAYAEKEKSLMLDRLREKEAQIKDIMGETYLQKHPVFTPELQRDIARIDANVAKLRGGASNLPNGWSVKVH